MMSSRTPRSRKDFASATRIIMDTLQSGEPFTMNKLVEKTGLNFRTVKKAVDLLETLQKGFLETKIDISHANKLTLIQLKNRIGLASLPENIQQLIIKTAYYPTVSREEEILAYLLLHNAVDAYSGISIQRDKTLEDLVEAEHVEVKDGKYYLTSVGKMTSEGALKLYPELRTITQSTQHIAT